MGASSNPCSDTYAGPKAFSEPETQNMKNFILARQGQIKAYVSMHSYGQVIKIVNRLLLMEKRIK